jgi:hypothetical protein
MKWVRTILSVCYDEEQFGDPGEFATHPRNEKIGLESGILKIHEKLLSSEP